MNLFEAHQILKLQSDGNGGQVTDRKEIEKAYRKQALKLHPDRAGGDASLFRQLQAAKEVALLQFGSLLTRSSYIMNNSAVGETLHKERTCVRQVVTGLNHLNQRIVVATDDGLWLLTKTPTAPEWTCQTFEAEKSFFCCSIVGDMVYAGGKCGQLFWLDLSSLNHGSISTPFQDANILSLSISSQGWICISTSKKAVAVVLNLSDTAGPPNMMLAWKTEVESTNPESIILEVSDDEEHLFLWIAGSKSSSNKGELMLWRLETSELYGELVDFDAAWELDDNDEEASDSEGSSGALMSPLIIQAIEEGPVYSIAKCNDAIAAIVGQAVLVWEFWSEEACLLPLKTLSLPGDYEETLYAVSLSDEFLVAAGLGEVLFVWSTDTWELIHTVSVTRKRESCFTSCCVLTTDWIPDEKGVVACGGYDGCVSLWRFAHRLENEG